MTSWSGTKSCSSPLIHYSSHLEHLWTCVMCNDERPSTLLDCYEKKWMGVTELMWLQAPSSAPAQVTTLQPIHAEKKWVLSTLCWRKRIPKSENISLYGKAHWITTHSCHCMKKNKKTGHHMNVNSKNMRLGIRALRVKRGQNITNNINRILRILTISS